MPCHIRPTAPNPDYRTELDVYSELDPSFPHQISHFSFSISPAILSLPHANASHFLTNSQHQSSHSSEDQRNARDGSQGSTTATENADRRRY